MGNKQRLYIYILYLGVFKVSKENTSSEEDECMRKAEKKDPAVPGP